MGLAFNSLLQRLRGVPPPTALDRGRMCLVVLCPRCRQPMAFAGASATEGSAHRHGPALSRWRCGSCRNISTEIS